jgi:hypothetical protein
MPLVQIGNTNRINTEEIFRKYELLAIMDAKQSGQSVIVPKNIRLIQAHLKINQASCQITLNAIQVIIY